jgi:hypothetical protein
VDGRPSIVRLRESPALTMPGNLISHTDSELEGRHFWRFRPNFSEAVLLTFSPRKKNLIPNCFHLVFLVSLPNNSEAVDDGLPLNRQMLQKSSDLIAVSRAHVVNSRTALEQSFRLLASFSKKIDVGIYRLGAATKILLVDVDPSALQALSAFLRSMAIK